MNKKYELLKDDTIEVEGHALHRIRLLKDLGHVKAGTLGGYIEKEDNLSHSGECWVANEAKVYGDASVRENAIVDDVAVVKDRATLMEMAYICDSAVVCDHVMIRGTASVNEDAVVGGEVDISESSYICGNASIKGEGFICDGAYVSGNTVIDGDFEIYDCVILGGKINGDKVIIKGDILISEGADISGDSFINGGAIINFKVTHTSDYFTYRDPSRPHVVVTASMHEDIWNFGDFSGTAKEFIDYGYSLTDTNGKANEEMVEYHNNLKSKYWS